MSDKSISRCACTSLLSLSSRYPVSLYLQYAFNLSPSGSPLFCLTADNHAKYCNCFDMYLRSHCGGNENEKLFFSNGRIFFSSSWCSHMMHSCHRGSLLLTYTESYFSFTLFSVLIFFGVDHHKYMVSIHDLCN